jgi:hypothetical protein
MCFLRISVGCGSIALESRRADLMAESMRRHGGVPFVAPSVKEIPFDRHEGNGFLRAISIWPC